MTKYSRWNHYFQSNAWAPDDFSFAAQPTLPAEERDLLGPSLRQFQLGEGSDGLGLLRRARAHGGEQLAETMQLFIREEQRHSAVLGLFLDQELIPRLRKHWVDGLFRKLRGLAGFELMLTVLATAEYIAVPYYTAIHDVTTSLQLRRIANRILLDEAVHIEFQAGNFEQCARNRGDLGRFLTAAVHLAALTSAAVFVYALHARLFRAASMSPLRFWTLALDAHRPVLRRLAGQAAGRRHGVLTS